MGNAFAGARRAVVTVLLAGLPAMVVLAMLLSVPGGAATGLLLGLLLGLAMMVAGLLLAAPAMALLRFIGRDSLGAHLFVGFLAGSLLGSAAFGRMSNSDADPGAPTYDVQAGRVGGAIGGAYGIWSAGLWYALVRRKRRKAVEFPMARASTSPPRR